MEKENPKISVLSKLNLSAADNISKSPFLNPLEKRWSPRAFKGEQIDRSLVKAIFDSSKQAESSCNDQPWRILMEETERDA